MSKTEQIDFEAYELDKVRFALGVLQDTGKECAMLTFVCDGGAEIPIAFTTHQLIEFREALNKMISSSAECNDGYIITG